MRRCGRCGHEKHVDSAKKRRQAALAERIEYLVAFLREHPCVDCGETDPVVLEFDPQRPGLAERS